jgi:hypothetical protein
LPTDGAPRRLAIVVPGHGSLGRDGVYRISARCRRLVEDAAILADRLAAETVVFTGWSPVGGPSEAEQMRDAWPGPQAPLELVIEPTARTTAQNAARTLPLLVERDVQQAVVVCAPLHFVRARYFFSRLYEDAGIETTLSVVRLAPSPHALVWELVAMPLRRAQLRAVRAETARRRSHS